jgi:hypothetical protein
VPAINTRQVAAEISEEPRHTTNKKPNQFNISINLHVIPKQGNKPVAGAPGINKLNTLTKQPNEVDQLATPLKQQAKPADLIARKQEHQDVREDE